MGCENSCSDSDGSHSEHVFLYSSDNLGDNSADGMGSVDARSGEKHNSTARSAVGNMESNLNDEGSRETQAVISHGTQLSSTPVLPLLPKQPETPSPNHRPRFGWGLSRGSLGVCDDSGGFIALDVMGNEEVRAPPPLSEKTSKLATIRSMRSRGLSRANSSGTINSLGQTNSTTKTVNSLSITPSSTNATAKSLTSLSELLPPVEHGVGERDE